MTTTQEQIVIEQIHAYNNRNISNFLATYDESAKIYNGETGALIMDGHLSMMPHYQGRFKNSPNLQAVITKRLTMGSLIVDLEYVTGIGANNQSNNCIVMYQVGEKTITKAWFFTPSKSGSTQDPELIIEQQIEAYNQRDPQLFMNTYHHNAKVFSGWDCSVLMSAKENMSLLYQHLFDKSPQLKATVLNRMVLNNLVIDHESVAGMGDSSEAKEAIVVYQLTKDSLINSVWLYEMPLTTCI